MNIGPKGGPLEKIFFETCFYQFRMIVLMKENVCDGFKAIWSLIKNFQNWSKKSLRGDQRTKGVPLEKNFFETCLYEFKRIVLMKKNVFDGLKTIWNLIKNFQNWSKKRLRGDYRTKRGTIGKNFFPNMFLSVQNDCFDERKRLWWF